MSMLNNIVGYWAYSQGTYVCGAYIWDEVSVIVRGLQSLYFLVIDTQGSQVDRMVI